MDDEQPELARGDRVMANVRDNESEGIVDQVFDDGTTLVGLDTGQYAGVTVRYPTALLKRVPPPEASS